MTLRIKRGMTGKGYWLMAYYPDGTWEGVCYLMPDELKEVEWLLDS